MVTVLFWPNGDWAYEAEVWKPDPGFRTIRIPEFWPDDRVDEHIQKLVNEEAS